MEKKRIGQCPLCGGDVVKTAKGYRCVNNTGDPSKCRFFVNSILGNRNMSDSEVSELLEKKEILLDGFATKEGKCFTTVLHLDASGQVVMDGNVCKCPNCGGDVRVNARSFYCANYHHPEKPCSFTAWRNMAGHSLSLTEVREICAAGETSETKVFFTDDGTPYDKHLSLSDDKLKVLKS